MYLYQCTVLLLHSSSRATRRGRGWACAWKSLISSQTYFLALVGEIANIIIHHLVLEHVGACLAFASSAHVRHSHVNVPCQR
jgi:hypothetical protein